MSLIYSKLTAVLNKITYEFRRSFIFTTIFSILTFIEKQWVNSYFKSFYPSENFLDFLNKNKIIRNYLFSPLIILFVFAIFLILSLNRLTDSLIMTLIIAFVFFFVGAVVLPRFFIRNSSKKPALSFNAKDMYSIGFCLIILSIVFFFISIASVGGIPLLKPSIRYLLKPAFTMPVFLIIPGICIVGSVYLQYYKENKISRSQIRFRLLVLILISGALLLGLGYRTPLLAALLIMIIMGYYGKVLSPWEVVIGALIGVGAIIGIGYFRSVSEYTITATSPFYALQSRADFTLHVLDLLNYISGDFGLTKGSLLASSIPGSELGPRMMIGKLISWRTEVTVTPTLIGQMVVDFGRVGVAVEMCILGFILGIGFKIMRMTDNYFYIGLYSLLLTYSILGVETGILDIQVLGYFAIAILVYAIYIVKNIKNEEKI
ncbi:MAG: oligosaccharide repeat unit polymerase family protein [Methanobrevibacter sp.]|uniref:oligosaccharide repeat unit polymerase family protein n=1 Tax=Methanobrevibacter sp. TaxID=66852 RepID=UPI0026E051B7|nr:oligosaccharide repeat unit polymerase family protein [Methanobrevibacter sp.]MDO5848409.1 oligosaccharide repeat unit polymerase family protein [Methanobrevibacter sp.]